MGNCPPRFYVACRSIKPISTRGADCAPIVLLAHPAGGIVISYKLIILLH